VEKRGIKICSGGGSRRRVHGVSQQNCNFQGSEPISFAQDFAEKAARQAKGFGSPEKGKLL